MTVLIEEKEQAHETVKISTPFEPKETFLLDFQSLNPPRRASSLELETIPHQPY